MLNANSTPQNGVCVNGGAGYIEGVANLPHLSPGMVALFTGILVLMLALAMWKLTHNVWAWLVLFIPGAGYTVYGLYRVLVKGDV